MLTKTELITRYQKYLASDESLNQAVTLGIITQETAELLQAERFAQGTVATAADLLTAKAEMQQLSGDLALFMLQQAQSETETNEAMAALMLQVAQTQTGGNA